MANSYTAFTTCCVCVGGKVQMEICPNPKALTTPHPAIFCLSFLFLIVGRYA